MNRLLYTKNAAYWDEALPLGNGRLGAMVFGKTDEEIIQLNEETLWNGKEKKRINPDSLKNLGKIREYIKNGEILKAEKLAVDALSGTPQYQRCYQTLGELRITHHKKPDKINAYHRELKLDTAQVMVDYQTENGKYSEEIFISHPADCMMIIMKAEGGTVLDFHCRFDRGRYSETAFSYGNDTIIFGGNSGGRVFAGILAVIECDGVIHAVGEHLCVEGASKAVLVFTAATDYEVLEPVECIKRIISRTRKKTIEELREEHIRDYQKLYKKVALCFEGTEPEIESMPTDLRLQRIRNGETDPDLIATYFQYGRYLMISSSREGGLPANLQGIWNADFTPPWDSKYTININLQMNYWMTDICNLSECYEPYFSLLKKVQKNGHETAQKMYGCRGFVAHHNVDMYGDTAPQDQYIPATYWVMGGAWMALHIWEHYEFTKDLEFLKKHYDILEDAVLFFRDFLIKDENGCLVTSPSVSPENTYLLEDGTKGRLCAGPTMDNEILTDLFRYFLNASEELGKTSDIVNETMEMAKQIAKPQIGRYGQIMEWSRDYEEAEPGHRHISHLFGVFPSSQINFTDTPELMEAAERTLRRRLKYGGGHTGWSCAWIILLWTRFYRPEEAYKSLKKLLSESTFDNLMDNHPYKCERGKVFQIDGNLGTCVGIAEMLIQSQNGCIHILPALPDELKNGHVSGLCVRGCGETELEWKDGELKYFKIKMHYAGEYRLCYHGHCTIIKLEKDQWNCFNERLEKMK